MAKTQGDFYRALAGLGADIVSAAARIEAACVEGRRHGAALVEITAPITDGVLEIPDQYAPLLPDQAKMLEQVERVRASLETVAMGVVVAMAAVPPVAGPAAKPPAS